MPVAKAAGIFDYFRRSDYCITLAGVPLFSLSRCIETCASLSVSGTSRNEKGFNVGWNVRLRRKGECVTHGAALIQGVGGAGRALLLDDGLQTAAGKLADTVGAVA